MSMIIGICFQSINSKFRDLPQSNRLLGTCTHSLPHTWSITSVHKKLPLSQETDFTISMCLKTSTTETITISPALSLIHGHSTSSYMIELHNLHSLQGKYMSSLILPLHFRSQYRKMVKYKIHRTLPYKDQERMFSKLSHLAMDT